MLREGDDCCPGNIAQTQGASQRLSALSPDINVVGVLTLRQPAPSACAKLPSYHSGGRSMLREGDGCYPQTKQQALASVMEPNLTAACSHCFVTLS